MKAQNGKKFCPKCKRFLDAEKKFGRDKQKADGLHSHCRLCRRGYRLLRKPIPEIQYVVPTMYPRRTSVPTEYWDYWDQLVLAGVAVTIIRPDESRVDWSNLT